MVIAKTREVVRLVVVRDHLGVEATMRVVRRRRPVGQRPPQWNDYRRRWRATYRRMS